MFLSCVLFECFGFIEIEIVVMFYANMVMYFTDELDISCFCFTFVYQVSQRSDCVGLK